MTPPLKVDSACARWQCVGNACARRSVASLLTSNERVVLVSFLSTVLRITSGNLRRFSPFVLLQIKIYCYTLSSLVLVCSSCFPAIATLAPHLIVTVWSQRRRIFDVSAACLYAYFHTRSFLNIIQSFNPFCWFNYNKIKK